MKTTLCGRTLLLCTVLFLELFLKTICQDYIGPFYSPCAFPTPIMRPNEYLDLCQAYVKLPYLCDAHQQISVSGVGEISEAFARYKNVFLSNTTRLTIAVILVRQLYQPSDVNTVYTSKLAYGCLFDRREDCIRMDHEQITSFVTKRKAFAKIYASILYDRWFEQARSVDTGKHCSMPNVLMLVAVRGVTNDMRMLPIVEVTSGDLRLNAYFYNIELESINAILQGWPIHAVVADLITQVGKALSEYHEHDGERIQHSIPEWAMRSFALCGALISMALLMEWYLVRKRLKNRNAVNVPGSATKSKTHLMF